MDKNWNKIEKAIGVLEVLFGFTIITFFTYSWGVTIQQLVEDGQTTWSWRGIFNIFKHGYSLLILCTFSIFSGVLLLKKMKIGWITSILNWVFISCYHLYNLWKTYTYSEETINLFIFFVFVSIIFLAISFTLVQKPFREKYSSKS